MKTHADEKMTTKICFKKERKRFGKRTKCCLTVISLCPNVFLKASMPRIVQNQYRV